MLPLVFMLPVMLCKLSFYSPLKQYKLLAIQANALAAKGMEMSGISTREVHYSAPDGTALIGYFAYPLDASQPVAGVVVCPEWWGVTPHPKNRAEQLARDGYAALAIDMYGDARVTDQVSQASAWMNEVLQDQNILIARAKAGLEALAAQPEVDASRLAVIGFCFGGKVALDMAREGLGLKAAVSFHGILSPKAPAQAGKVTAEVQVNHGEQDSMVSLQAVEGFKQEMQAAGVNYVVNIYPNAKHGFTNPVADERAKANGVDLGYNQQADEQSNTAMLQLFARTLA